MHALLFSAGLGTRMRELTADRPKALVPVLGKPLIDHALEKLRLAGATDVVVNLHHFADMLEAHLRSRDWGLTVHFSDERDLLRDTGGGLLHAAPLLGGNEPFWVCNVDVLTDLDLRALYEAHCASGALATLAVQQRQSARQFLFDEKLRLVGWENASKNALRMAVAENPETCLRRAFSGIQVVSPEIFGLVRRSGVFSLVDLYLDLAAEHCIQGFDHTGGTWHDVGSPEKRAKVEGENG